MAESMPLLTPYQMGPCALSNRFVLAAMGRNRAGPTISRPT